MHIFSVSLALKFAISFTNSIIPITHLIRFPRQSKLNGIERESSSLEGLFRREANWVTGSSQHSTINCIAQRAVEDPSGGAPGAPPPIGADSTAFVMQ